MSLNLNPFQYLLLLLSIQTTLSVHFTNTLSSMFLQNACERQSLGLDKRGRPIEKQNWQKGEAEAKAVSQLSHV